MANFLCFDLFFVLLVSFWITCKFRADTFFVWFFCFDFLLFHFFSSLNLQMMLVKLHIFFLLCLEGFFDIFIGNHEILFHIFQPHKTLCVSSNCKSQEVSRRRKSVIGVFIRKFSESTHFKEKKMMVPKKAYKTNTIHASERAIHLFFHIANKKTCYIGTSKSFQFLCCRLLWSFWSFKWCGVVGRSILGTKFIIIIILQEYSIQSKQKNTNILILSL